MTPMSEETDTARVTLAVCPIGLFLCGDTLALKTEYGSNEGRIDAYIVSSGEFFWGHAPQSIANQRATLVVPVDTDAAHRLAQAAPAGDGREADWHDVITHRSAWREAIILARDEASEGSEDPDADRSYWNHELRAFDRTFDKLAALTARPDDGQNESGITDAEINEAIRHGFGDKTAVYLHAIDELTTEDERERLFATLHSLKCNPVLDEIPLVMAEVIAILRRPYTPKHTATGGADREAVARIIDPIAWRNSDSYRACMAESVRKRQCAQDTVDRCALSGGVAASLAKADVILAALAQPERDAEVARLKEALERISRCQNAATDYKNVVQAIARAALDTSAAAEVAK